MQVSSCRLSWFVGQGSTQRMIFYNKKKKSRIGLDEIDIFIRKKKICIPFLNENLFFREKYTCVLLFLGCFSFSCVLSVSRKCHWWVSTHYCVYLTVRVWHAVQLAGPEIHERSTRTIPRYDEKTPHESLLFIQEWHQHVQIQLNVSHQHLRIFLIKSFLPFNSPFRYV